MKKYIGSIVQLIGAACIVIAASLVNVVLAVSLGGLLLLFFGIALERRLF
jgi:hypothetical protein